MFEMLIVATVLLVQLPATYLLCVKGVPISDRATQVLLAVNTSFLCWACGVPGLGVLATFFSLAVHGPLYAIVLMGSLLVGVIGLGAYGFVVFACFTGFSRAQWVLTAARIGTSAIATTCLLYSVWPSTMALPAWVMAQLGTFIFGAVSMTNALVLKGLVSRFVVLPAAMPTFLEEMMLPRHMGALCRDRMRKAAVANAPPSSPPSSQESSYSGPETDEEDKEDQEVVSEADEGEGSKAESTLRKRHPDSQSTRRGSMSAWPSSAAASSAAVTPETVRTWKNVSIEVSEGVLLDAMLLQTETREGEPVVLKDERWTMWLLGNGSYYEFILDMLGKYATEVNTNILCFNYRGVGRSTGVPTSGTDLVDDARAVLQYIISKGVDMDKILIHGHSLGGAVGTLVRAQYPGPLINDRSFSSLNAVPQTWIRELLPPAVAISPVQPALSSFVQSLIEFMGWSLDAAHAWRSLSTERVCLYHMHDEIIDFNGASLYSRVACLTKNKLYSHTGDVPVGVPVALSNVHGNVPVAKAQAPEDGAGRGSGVVSKDGKCTFMQLTRKCTSPHNFRLDESSTDWNAVTAEAKRLLYGTSAEQ